MSVVRRSAVPVLRTCSGAVCDGSDWSGEPTPADRRVLEQCLPPVLDVGCGPARHSQVLAERGVPVLGLDITGAMLDAARPKGVAVLERDVFGRVPATGWWGTVLLLDGNIGIGGDPAALLRRVANLVRPGGVVLVELVTTTKEDQPVQARIELDGRAGPWFGWATVDVDELTTLVRASRNLSISEIWIDDARTFARLERHRVRG